MIGIYPMLRSLFRGLAALPKRDLIRVIAAFGAVIAIPALAVTLFGQELWRQAEAALPAGFLGPLLFVLGTALVPALAIVPSHAAAFLAGHLFGIALGIPLTVLGLLGGVILGRAIGRAGLCGSMDRLIAGHPSVERWRAAITAPESKPATIAIALFRLSPIFPFAATNLLLGALAVPLARSLLASFLGLLPRASLGVLAGASVQRFQEGSRLEAGLLLAFAVIGLIGLGLVARRLAPKAPSGAAAVTRPAPGA